MITVWEVKVTHADVVRETRRAKLLAAKSKVEVGLNRGV